MECSSCKTPLDDSLRICPHCGALQPSAANDPLVGTSLGGRYRILKLLGEGGMGAVYVGEQQMGTKTRKVAVKTLHPHLSKDPKVKARFEREIGTIAELEHPNTITVYDWGTTADGILYLIMEFVDGINVADLLERNGAMDPTRVEKIMMQVCGSLEEAHSRGIIHRDLKPENVVLTERAGSKDFVKVLDFGIAKRSTEEDKQEQKLTQQGMVLGTPPYMSPEQFTGKPIDARSDIYSLGVMMYEMLSGKLPFQANTAWEWATQHMTVPPIAIETTGAHVPERMRIAIMRALEKDPARRPSSMREFSDAFAGATGGSASARPPAPVGMGAMQGSPGAAPPSPEPLKGKTQMGEPLMAPMQYGAPPSPYGAGAAPGSPPYAAPVQAGTPSAGNLAVPAVVPQAPPRTAQGGGGGKGGIIAAIAVIGVASLVAIGWAVMPHSSKVPAGGLDFDAGPPPVNITPTADTSNTPTPPADTSGLAALNTKPIPVPPHTPATHHDAGGGTKPPPTPSGGGTTPPAPSPSPAPPLPADVEAACAQAKRLQNNPILSKDPAMNNLFNTARAKCISGGGKL
jgi:serine/threonine-protein kinase